MTRATPVLKRIALTGRRFLFSLLVGSVLLELWLPSSGASLFFLLAKQVFVPAPAKAEVSAPESPAEKLTRIRAQIRKEKASLQAILQKKGGVLEKLSALQGKLNRTRERMAELNKEEEALAAEAKVLTEAAQRLAVEVEAQRRIMAKRLRARYRFGRVSALRVLFSAQTMAELSRRRKNLEVLYQADRQRLEEYNRLLSQYAASQAAIRAKEEEIKEVALVLSEEESELQVDEAQLKKILTAVREEEETRRQLLAELTADANRLSGVIARLDSRPRRSPSSPERLSAKVEKSDDPSGEEEKQAEEEKEEAASGSFSQRRGRMCMPVAGPILVGFGKREHPQFHTLTVHNGVEIGAPLGAPVRAVAEGTVRFAQWFQGYGNVIIIEHEDGYYSVYGHLSQILVSAGQEVEARQIIGKVGDTGSLAGPSLYFELRHHQTPLNPLAWLRNCS